MTSCACLSSLYSLSPGSVIEILRDWRESAKVDESSTDMASAALMVQAGPGAGGGELGAAHAG
jgi:hypothetical protein